MVDFFLTNPEKSGLERNEGVELDIGIKNMRGNDTLEMK